mmetsp:Transcript_108418/g.209893  ORF Transcript_108418/g.209893 Transcript_108418/m.209893 type:complete len:243 (+) Transcript_108418:41-769(+)
MASTCSLLGRIARVTCTRPRNFRPLPPLSACRGWDSLVATRHAGATIRSPPLIAAHNSNVGKLAGALAGRIRAEDAADVSVIGPAATYAAVKAIMIAGQYLQDNQPGVCLGFSPAKQALSVHGGTSGEKETVGLLLHTRAVADPGTQNEPPVFAAGDTNVGNMASLMKTPLGMGNSITIGCMGARAVSSALKATIIATKYMEGDLMQHETLVLVPRYETFKVDSVDSEERVRILLTCSRATA